ncbi:MAG: hypothetical protein JWO88_3965 [Frankiales bacterium]|nr:hypothetical protein [Frankiales bacterium]
MDAECTWFNFRVDRIRVSAESPLLKTHVAALFDHLVGAGNEKRRDIEAEFSRGLKVEP